MSYSEYASVVFSKVLAQAPGTIKRNALGKLERYLKKKNHLQSRSEIFVPLDLYISGREKIYSGKEIFAAHMTQDDKTQVEALGFCVRHYRTTPGKDAGYVTIAISRQLSIDTPEAKVNAIKNLETYLEARPDIWTGFEHPIAIAEAADRILTGPNKRHLSMSVQTRIIGGLLTRDQGREIAALGFDVFKDSNGQAFI
jgi:hypothetical protein